MKARIKSEITRSHPGEEGRRRTRGKVGGIQHWAVVIWPPEAQTACEARTADNPPVGGMARALRSRGRQVHNFSFVRSTSDQQRHVKVLHLSHPDICTFSHFFFLLSPLRRNMTHLPVDARPVRLPPPPRDVSKQIWREEKRTVTRSSSAVSPPPSFPSLRAHLAAGSAASSPGWSGSTDLRSATARPP